MKRSLFLTSAFSIMLPVLAMMPLPATTFEKVYEFNKCNIFKMEMYASGNELMRTTEVRTYYQSPGGNFLVKFMPGKNGYSQETIIDKKNELAVQIFNAGTSSATYNSGGYKYPSPEDLKKLELTSTEEMKEILGYQCRKFTYTYKKVFGEVWITDQVNMDNDYGVFRACKMAALHNTLSEGGFVMEMTTEDAKGGRTLMTTVALEKDETFRVDLSKVQVSTAINKVNYFTF